MTPEAITLLFEEATEAFTLINGKPTDDDLLAIRETLLPLLMDIPYNHLGGVHSLTGLITKATTYTAEHGNVAFVRPTCLPLYNAIIQDNATKVVRVKLDTSHTALVNNYASFKAMERVKKSFIVGRQYLA